MPDIKLNFVNLSNDVNNSDILIFQRNGAGSYNETAVAWLVIKNCIPGWNHPFIYPAEMYVSANDSWGNYSRQLAAANGQQFSIVENASGDILQHSGNASSPTEVEVLNALNVGAINANIFKDGRLLATTPSIPPGQKAVFEFKPTIWIGVVSQIEEGKVIDAAILSQIETEISLFGIKSADIVMTGGGPGPTATPFVFALQNIVYP
jgi:hypothetical protein